MGQRLNIELILNGETKANAYYHWSGYTSSSIGLTSLVLEHTKTIQHDNAVIRAVRLLEATGALLTEDEIKAAKNIAPNERFDLAKSRNDGLIAITEKGISETRNWEEARVEIDFDHESINFSAIWTNEKETFLEDYEKEEEEYEQLPVSKYHFYDISFDEFPLFAEDILEHIKKGMYYLRLEDGDVVSFIE